MNLTEIEKVWALQPAPQPTEADLSALKRTLAAQVGRRRRLLRLGIGTTALGLLLSQVLFFANFAGTPAESHGLFLLRLVLHQGVHLAILFELIRLVLRQRRLARGRADSVRAVEMLRLAGVEEEMAALRKLLWALPMLAGLGLFSAYLNQPPSRAGLEPFALRAALVLGVIALMGVVTGWHFRRHLRPERDRLQTTLAQMGVGSQE